MQKSQFDEILNHIKTHVTPSFSLGIHLDNGITVVGRAEMLGTTTILLTTATNQKQYIDLDRVVFLTVI